MDRWKTIPVIMSVCLLVYGGFVFAQMQQPPPSRGGAPGGMDPRMEQMIDRMFQEMDTNHDGRISKSEWMAFQQKQFNRIDKNGDGYITRDEVRADMMQRMSPPPQQERARPPQ